MLESIYIAIRSLLKDDSDILTLLGAASVFISHISQAKVFPSITILETSEQSRKRNCYNEFLIRENTSVVQIDVWSKSSRLETVKLATRIDELLVADGVSNTWGWSKISDGDMFEDDLRVYHKPLRYSFSYKIDDS